MKTYFKSILRSVKSNIARFISIVVIMMLGIAFVGGLGTICQTFKDSYSDQMNADHFADIVIKCKSEKGFSAETIALIEGSPLVEEISTLTSEETRTLYDSIRSTLSEMTEKGGRDTEKTIHALPGNYPTRMSKNTLVSGCPRCGSSITKESYMGGAVYFCPACQPL